MTRAEAKRLQRQEEVLVSLGFTLEEADKLRRISMTLQRWHELECGTDRGCIERDGENGDGKPFMTYERGNGARGRYAIPDREKGARKRLAAILARRNGGEVRHTACGKCDADIEGIAPFTEWRDRGNNAGDETHRHAPGVVDYGALTAYIQTDPRGAALYILRPGDVPAGKDAGSYYSRGICVY